MGKKVARLTDQIDHGGEIITSAKKTKAHGKLIARIGDHVMCVIHGDQTIVDGALKLRVEGKNCARIGSTCSCGAVIISGGEKVTTS